MEQTVTLPLYVFGKQTLETFLLASLEGCEIEREVLLLTHPVHQQRVLSNAKEGTYLCVELEDGDIKDSVSKETHAFVDDAADVLESYTSNSSIVQDVIGFVLDNETIMKQWVTKSYGSPTPMREFIKRLREVLYNGADFNTLSNIVTPLFDIGVIGRTASMRTDDNGILVIDEVAPTKVDAEKIFEAMENNSDVKGLHIYSNGVLKINIMKEEEEEIDGFD